jgi:hypothetical protein
MAAKYTARDQRSGIRDQGSGIRYHGPGIRRSMKNVAIAFIVAVVLGTAAIFLRPGGEAGHRQTTAGAGAVNAPEPPPADAAAWRAAFPLEPPDVLVFVGHVPAPGEKALAAALVPFRAGRYQEAAPLLEQVYVDHPELAEAALYLGISRLFTDEIPNGIEILRQAQTSPRPHVSTQAQWYALVGIARLREPASGLAEVREVCEKRGPFQARACAALEALRGGARAP